MKGTLWRNPGLFADEIFPAIDEERFSILYSDKASRPNTPVNVIIGALIIKELFDYSDDEIVENLMLDLHLQCALHTTSFAEQPLSDKTLRRFRKRCYDYETPHGVDLYHDCVKDLSSKISKIMKLNGRIRRMDSIMIESNIRFLSRMEAAHLKFVLEQAENITMSHIDEQSYDKEIQRTKWETPESVKRLLPRLKSDETEVVIVTLPEATPVYEALRLEDDLNRAQIAANWWVINQSFYHANSTNSLLKAKASNEVELSQHRSCSMQMELRLAP